MKLLIVIPTWNRANYLDKAIHAIADARAGAGGCDVELFISDNCSSDHTQELVNRWLEKSPWIHYRRWEEHVPRGTKILWRAFFGSDLEYDYLWLHGDDDYICDVTAFAKLIDALEATAEDPPAIVHCCAARRSLPGDQRVLAGNTEDLCNTYGWHDLLGWISSLVISKETVNRMMDCPQWKVEPPSAFFHSEALLEVSYGRTMLILATGLIDPQEKSQTPESLDRWAIANVEEAYWGVIPGLMNLKERGVLLTPLTLGFFRYLRYSFWDRFAAEIIVLASCHDTNIEVLDKKLQQLSHFASLIGYGEDRKLYEDWAEGFQDDVKEIRRSVQLIYRRVNQAQRPSYANNLLPLN